MPFPSHRATGSQSEWKFRYSHSSSTSCSTSNPAFVTFIEMSIETEFKTVLTAC